MAMVEKYIPPSRRKAPKLVPTVRDRGVRNKLGLYPDDEAERKSKIPPERSRDVVPPNPTPEVPTTFFEVKRFKVEKVVSTPEVSIIAFTVADPKYISGYCITQIDLDDPPRANEFAKWSAEPPETYTLRGSYGDHRLAAWVRGVDGRVSQGKREVVRYIQLA